MDIIDSTVTLMIEELDRSIGFYTGRLGFSVEYRADPHFAMLRRGGLRLGLHPRGENPGVGACEGVSLGFQVEDIRGAVRELRAAEVSFPGGIVEDGPLLRADFRDPDGMALYLIEMK